MEDVDWGGRRKSRDTTMKFYMAPLEEMTGYIYRRAYHQFFCPMDKYFAPFIAAKMN